MNTDSAENELLYLYEETFIVLLKFLYPISPYGT